MASFTLAAVKHTAAQTKEKYALQEANAHRIWFIIAAVVGTCTVANWTSKAIAYLSSSHGSATDAEGNGSSPPRKSSLRRVPSAIAAALRVLAFRLWLPTGFGVVLFSEMAFITAYITATFCLLYVDSKCTCIIRKRLAHIGMLGDHLSVWFFEDRAAQMAVIQLPFIVALAGKNNVISFLTGISHEKVRCSLLVLYVLALTEPFPSSTSSTEPPPGRS
jgi:ferric-chelate reductase